MGLDSDRRTRTDHKTNKMWHPRSKESKSKKKTKLKSSERDLRVKISLEGRLPRAEAGNTATRILPTSSFSSNSSSVILTLTSTILSRECRSLRRGKGSKVWRTIAVSIRYKFRR